MAVGDHLPIIVPSSASVNSSSISKSTSPSSSPIIERRRFAPVATHNSSTFIRFPTSARQSTLFVPVYQPQVRVSSVQPCSLTTDTQSISNKSKSSNTPPSSIGSDQHKHNYSQQRSNPILNNPLLNHRKEQPKLFSKKFSTNFSHTTRICLSSKTNSNDNQLSTNHTSTAPLLTHQIENTADTIITANDDENSDQQEIEYFCKTKYDYITRWLHDVRQATYCTETFPTTKRSKKRFVQS
ncbi:unnamed protein product [Rotaria sp. Silwood1]|nr:unnamed protein product [Rotaria sp. Silwood1]CAF3395109.1 unnamed protein product [Rotaria sp. Silwood1]CAF3399718.1 unnamed protein product [Rotaria sp. Silwood1]CAF4624686.1 unnamed protein product [Rotaria sp. Silwood1]CAF4648738.1 unnamed protein product [Rotaria sp. Silwood1]